MRSRPGNIRHHYRLVQGMARTTGADLAGAFAEGRLGAAQWAGMVQSCRRCGWAMGCRDWLRRRPAAQTAPEPCRNRARLALLRLEEELSQ